MMRKTITVALALGHMAAHANAPLPPDAVLTSTDRVKVTYADFEAEISRIPERDRFEFLLNRQRLATVVENILVNKTLALEARQNGLDKEAKVRAEIDNQTDKVLAKYRGQQIQTETAVPDLTAKARETYITSPARYHKEAQYDTWHVLVDLKGRTKDQALARANEVLIKAKNGANREELARQYSDDASVYQNKGRLGFLNGSSFDPRYASAIAKLKIGELGPIVETQFGFHVVELHGKIPESKISFEEAKSELLHEARGKFLDSAWANHIEQIRSDKTLKVNIEALDAIRPKVPEIPKAAATPTKPN
jgi:peptidyl-prolyl cis-trans isomerase C